ncbi:phosphoribosylglycinamide formyltransferase [Paenibacillus darwinianus]|uniref:Phosphoribosylglycinamide formyltransferase n=1 Tax=Paenibacillus darwinianus TaxID=1380763 RepID=A0A9W5S0Q1_9BACL|nr:phosphoribosylglycinamide formyltransferase [Paenibacillus darwinianus]EXX85619.1 phosphoribosylglycinamide formyltransferase [Paenibacillus darwinianus]EXX85844.1 phosphoribosylglycinamide formyltransferase [Paenibacillus darwinianus]EXX86570.1 phosphoribosylglycinamide formyltransferase [Paenibacillus darwinianus]
MKKLKIAVFASGQGTNFQALADAAADGRLDVDIELLVCDKAAAPVVARAEQAGVDVYVFTPKAYPSREAYETEILAELQRRGVELIVLAGYMRIITQVLVEPFYGRMINVHPALLPAFPGVNGIRQALDYGVKVTGVTVHYVDGGMDSGPIIAQRAVEVLDGDSEEALRARVHKVERELLPWVIAQIASGRVELNGRQVTVAAEAMRSEG